MLALMLALAWAPLLSHCQLKALSGFEFLSCATDHQSPAEVPAHCDGTSCCAAELSKYPVPNHRSIVPAFVLVPLPFGVVAHCELPQRADVAHNRPAPVPPELSTAWHFIARAAPPCRAPSFLA